MKKALLLLLCGLFVSQANAQLWSGAQGDPQGWKYLDWLGWFWSPSEDAGWFYLENQGWAYTDADSTDSMFVYYEFWQWTWTSESLYPWSFNTSVLDGEIDWQYYAPGSVFPTLYFSDGSQFWRTGPFDFLGSYDYNDMAFESFELIQKLGNLVLLQGDTATYGLGDIDYAVDGGCGPFRLTKEDTDLAALEFATVLTGESKQLTFKIDIPPTLSGKTVDLLIGGGSVEIQAKNTDPVNSAIYALGKSDGVLGLVGIKNMITSVDTPAFETFVAEEGERIFNIYEGEFLGRGLAYFTPVLRYDPGNGEDPVFYGLKSPDHKSGSIVVNFQYSEPTPGLERNIVAQTDFRPTPDGFGFPNFGGTSDFLDAEDVYMIMGEDYAIEDDGGFVLTAKGCNWLSGSLSSMAGGHCYGISATVARLFDGLPYRGKTTPSDYQSGATEAIQLQRQNVSQVISFWMATQGNRNVSKAKNETKKNGPTWVLNQLIADMNGDQKIASLSIDGTISGHSAGHAITPYAIEKVDADTYRIHVWDNNFPGFFTNFIEVDTAANTWAYSSQLKGQTWYDSGFQGDATSESLGFTTMDVIEMIAHAPGGGGTPVPPITDTRILPAAGSAILASQGTDKVGYDFSTKSVINDWPDSEIVNRDDSNVTAELILPLSEIAFPESLTQAFSESFAVELGTRNSSEASSDSSVSTGIYVEGNSYANIIENVTLSTGETVMTYSHPSGLFIGIDASGDDVSVTPTICIGAQDNDTKEGLLFEVTPVNALGSSGGIDSLFVSADLSSSSVKAYQKVGDNFQELDDTQVTVTQQDCP